MCIRDRSCDRSGLLACQNEKAAISTLLRFAGAPANRLEELNIDAFLAQQETLDDAAKGPLGTLLSGMDKSHPWITQRVKALKDWIDKGHYDKVLGKGAKENPPLDPPAPIIENLESILSRGGLDTSLSTHLINDDDKRTNPTWKKLSLIHI